MLKIYLVLIVLLGLASQPGTVRAETFQLTDGQSLTGDVVSFNESGLVLRLPDEKYSDRLPWAKFSQADLKRLGQNPKVAPLVEPFLEVPLKEKPKKPEVQVKEPERLKRAGGHSLLGAMLSSSVGITVLVLLYGANIYAAFEVSIFRAQPRALVCGLAAIPLLGVLSPIIFLSMPTRLAPVEEPTAAEAAVSAPTYSVPETPEREADPSPGSLKISQAGRSGGSASSVPDTQVFQRGAFTFNRRFFETKFPGFFSVIRREAEKNLTLVVKSARLEIVAQRITRIAANDIHFQVQRGSGTEEVTMPFGEIVEVQLKHKDAV